jgi:predicted transcriptional regulator
VPTPKGQLTAPQLEIMEAAWTGSQEGVTVAEIREALPSGRSLARTTVLTQVKRLCARRWLVRNRRGSIDRYRPAIGREKATRRMAADFVDTYFDGSASELVMSLLGSRRVPPEEIQRLKALIDSEEADA